MTSLNAATRLLATDNELKLALTRIGGALGKPKHKKTSTRSVYTWESRSECYKVTLTYDLNDSLMELEVKLETQSYSIGFEFSGKARTYDRLRRAVFTDMHENRQAMFALKTDIGCVDRAWTNLENNL